MSLGRRQGHDPIPSLWRFHNPAETGETALIEEACGRAISCNHEILNEQARAILMARFEINDKAVR